MELTCRWQDAQHLGLMLPVRADGDERRPSCLFQDVERAQEIFLVVLGFAASSAGK